MSTRVLIVGGGVAGLEAAIALRDLAGDRVEVELCAGREDFVYRPFSVGEPYGAARVLRYDLRRLTEEAGAGFRLDNIAAVDDSARQATTHDGTELPYDYLLLACGSRMLWAVPGAVTFWGVADEGGVRRVVEKLREGGLGRLVFTVPSVSGWALPAYELALLAATEMSKRKLTGTRLTVVTPEDAPLLIFGRRASERVGELLAEHGIEVIVGTHPVKFENGTLSVAPGEDIEADAVVSLPRLEGRRVNGIPHDREGFVAVDEHGRILGLERAFAAGDVSAFPVKQGGIATQQADAVAEAIAAEIGCNVEAKPLDPLLRGVLWTGGDPLYLYGWLSGGHGETSIASEEPPWPVEHPSKMVGRYLSPFLAGLDDRDRHSQ